MPKWEGAILGWTIKFLKKAMRRICPLYEFEDALQEARMYFWICTQKYSDHITEPRHFMALYQRCLINRVNQISNYRTKKGRVLGVGAEEIDLYSLTDSPDDSVTRFEDQDQIDNASKNIQKIMVKMGLIESPRRYLKPKKPWYRSMNSFLCDLADVPHSCDMVNEILEWSRGESIERA